MGGEFPSVWVHIENKNRTAAFRSMQLSEMWLWPLFVLVSSIVVQALGRPQFAVDSEEGSLNAVIVLGVSALLTSLSVAAGVWPSFFTSATPALP